MSVTMPKQCQYMQSCHAYIVYTNVGRTTGGRLGTGGDVLCMYVHVCVFMHASTCFRRCITNIF